MRTLNKLRTLAVRLQALTPPRRPPDFICGDCERWRRCGLPPTANCIARAEQLSRNGGQPIRSTTLSEWASWGY